MAGAIMDKVWGMFGMDNTAREEYDDEVDFLEDEYDVHLIYWNRNDEELYSNFSSWCNDVREVHIPVLSFQDPR